MKAWFILIALLFPMLSSGQMNLVPNASFEDTIRCSSDTTITKAKVWYTPNCDSPDYFYPTMTGNWGCLSQYPAYWGGGGYMSPENAWGSQLPRTGIAYAGMAVSQGSEVMATPLIDSLQPGKTYAISFYASLADNNWGNGLDLISLSFMQDSVTDYNAATCQQFVWTLHVDAGNQAANFITDTAAWTVVQDTFIAEGGERFMILGNIDSANTQYYNSPIPNSCYYYFDDFDVHCIDCLSDTSEPPSYPEISVTPSLTSGEITLSGNFPDGTKFEVYDMLGQKIFYDELQRGNQSQTLFLTLADGAYIYRLEAAGTTLQTGKLVVTR